MAVLEIFTALLLMLAVHESLAQGRDRPNIGGVNYNRGAPSGYNPVSRLGQVPTTVAGCYQGDVYYPSNRLPNSLENLIYIIEKVETALLVQQNIQPNASFIATLLLRRFQVNGIADIENRDDKTVKQYEAIKQDIVFKFLPNISLGFPEAALTDKEKCSLHYMLSTSINDTSYDFYPNLNPYDPYNTLTYARENGAIYAGQYGTLSAGPVLAGIAASANIYTPRVRDLLTPDEQNHVDTGLDQVLDPVMAVTLAGEIGQSVIMYSYPQYKHIVIGPSGNWNGTVCPTVYTLTRNDSSSATDPELLGGIDGMIIGSYLRTNFQFLTGASASSPLFLSQVLKTYYGRGFQGNNILGGCDRRSQMSPLVALMSSTASSFATLFKAKGGYNSLQEFPDYSSIANFVQLAVQNFTSAYSDYFPCNATAVAQDCQTENDIVVVMDTSSGNPGYIDGFQEQKNFVGNLITRIGVYPNASHVGIMTYGGSVREPVPFSRDNSGGYVKCTLQWYNLFGGGNTDVAGTIRALQDRFRSIKNAQRSANQAQAPGRVIIFLYQQSSIPNIEDVRNAFSDFRTEHPDVLTLAVGSNKDILGNFVRDSDGDVFVQIGEQMSFAVDRVVQRLCKAPSLVEYRECDSGSNEQSYVANEFIYPDAYKWIALNEWTFNKSTNLQLTFQTTYGYARLCFSRYIKSVDPSGMTNCFETSQSNAQQIYSAGEPCKSYGSDCPWLYVNVRGKSKGAQSLDRCAEMACDSPNQIKLTVTHTGARCGSSQTLSEMRVTFISLMTVFIVLNCFSKYS